MPLRKEDIERIEREAENLYPTIKQFFKDSEHSFDYNSGKRQAYISGASTEAEKANELVEALEEAKEYFDNMADVDFTNESFIPNKEGKLFMKIQQALSNYKK